MSTNILEDLSSITETSDVFIKNIIQNGGDQDGGSMLDFIGGRTTLPLAVVCCCTVFITCITLISIISNKSYC